MSISPLGGWLIVSGQFYFTINREEIFYFCNKKMPYLCGFWRFANAYIMELRGEGKHDYKRKDGRAGIADVQSICCIQQIIQRKGCAGDAL
jgi:hypothetical protein